MSELVEALQGIGALAFGGFVILLLAPTLDPLVEMSVSGLGFLFLGGAIVILLVLVVVVINSLASNL